MTNLETICECGHRSDRHHNYGCVVEVVESYCECESFLKVIAQWHIDLLSKN